MEYTEKEIDAFMTYSKDADIAKAIGKSLRTVQNYKHDDRLKELLAKRRAEYVRNAINKMQISLCRAVEVLTEIIDDDTVAPQIRLNAINMLLSYSKHWMIDEDIAYYSHKENAHKTIDDMLE